jgi:thiamine pyrophosphokinase
MSDNTTNIDETVVVVLGAERLHPHSIADLPSDAYIIAADSGLDHARSAGLSPDEVVGDFDSISKRGLKWANQHAIVHEHSPDKDDTDTQLAIALAASRVPARLIVISGGGDRLDHTLAIFGALTDVDVTSIPDVSLRWGNNLATIVHGPGRANLRPPVQSTLSVVALSTPCTGVTLTGTKWTLTDESLQVLSGRGVSNIVEDEVEITLREGVLAIFHEPPTKG